MLSPFLSTSTPSADYIAPHTFPDLVSVVLDHVPMMVVVYAVVSRTEFTYAMMNATILERSGLCRADVINKHPEDIMPAEQAAATVATLQDCLDTGTTNPWEHAITLPNGTIWMESRYIPIQDAQGRITHILNASTDITARKMRELEEQQRQAEIIEHQAATLAELSTPLLVINDTTVVMPLVGAIDSRRVQQIMAVLLEGVAAYRAEIAIMDITGVPVVDTQVANALIRAAQSVKLLGAQVVLTGLRPEVAQTIVGLGVNLSEIVTRASLQSGIAFANTQHAR